MKNKGIYEQIELEMIKRTIKRAYAEEENRPREIYSGLSANGVRGLMRKFGTDDSPVIIREKIADNVLDRMPLFRLMEEFFTIVERDKGVGLTGLGYIKRKPLLELYQHKFIPVEQIDEGLWTLRGEGEWPAAIMLHDISHSAGWVRKYKGKLVLTKKGKALIEGPRHRFFHALLMWFTEFMWPELDGYGPAPHIERFPGFTIYLLLQYGGVKRKVTFYTEKFLGFCPEALDYVDADYFNNPREKFERLYDLRMFERFFEWFGMLEANRTERLDRGSTIVKTTEVFGRVFYLEPRNY